MKQSRFFFLALIVALPFIAFTQDDKIQLKAQDAAFGTSDLEMIDRLMYTVPGIGRDPRDIIERQSIKPYMMPVRKIGPGGRNSATSCRAAWSITSTSTRTIRIT